MVNPNDVFYGMGLSTLISLGGIVVAVVTLYAKARDSADAKIRQVKVDCDEKVRRVYGRLDDVKGDFVKKEIFELERDHLQENHRQVIKEVTDIKADSKTIITSLQSMNTRIEKLAIEFHVNKKNGGAS